MAGRFAKYEKVAQSYTRFFDCDDIALSLERKADLYMISTLNDKKANNADVAKDLAHSNNLIDKLNDRVKHISVV